MSECPKCGAELKIAAGGGPRYSFNEWKCGSHEWLNLLPPGITPGGKFRQTSSCRIRQLEQQLAAAQTEAGRLTAENNQIKALATIREFNASPDSASEILRAIVALADNKDGRVVLAYAKRLENILADKQSDNARLAARVAELEAVVTAVIAWNKRYPSSRIYSHGEIIKIAKEMDHINGMAKAAEASARPCCSFGADPDLKPGPLTPEDRGWQPDWREEL